MFNEHEDDMDPAEAEGVEPADDDEEEEDVGVDPVCCVAGTTILTNQGLKNIENIKPGDFVYALSENIDFDHKPYLYDREFGFYEVTEVCKSQTPKSVLEIKTTSGKTLSCTYDHPVRVKDIMQHMMKNNLMSQQA